MGQLACKYSAEQPINKKIHVGVAGSGDLEILVFPAEKTESTVRICTGSGGFGEVWDNVLTRLFNRYPVSADIVISDLGVTSRVVYLRLTQAMEELSDGKQFCKIKRQRTSEHST